MPGGLRDVSQKFTAETSGYIDGLRRMIESNRQLIDSVREVVQKTDEIKRVTGDDSGWRRMAASLSDTSAEIRRYNAVLDEAHAVNERFNATQVQTERLSRDARRALHDLADAHGMVRERVTSSQAEIARSHVEQMSLLDQMVTKLGVAREAYGKIAEVSAPVKATTEDLKVLKKTLDETFVDKGGVTRYVGGIKAAISEGASLTGLEGAERRVRAVADAWQSVADARKAVAQAESGIPAAATAALFGRGGTATVTAAMAAASGGGGGGGGWAALAAAAAGGGGGGFDKGTAGAAWAPVGTFLTTWLPRAHYVLMAANELAATLGPATVAAGMGTLVGLQGGEQAVPRLKAVFATAESLGGSLGTTAGQYMGLKTPALQNAQDLATGAAFGGIGALTNIMKAGGGAPFIQMGQSTASMWTGMMANLVTEFQHGLGKQLGDMVAGGPGYLSQFGHVFGNLGHLFLNVAPNLPGVGGDYLSVLQGTLGGLAKGTGWLGSALGPLLAAEAGGRIGTPLVGGVGALLGRAGRGIGGLADRFPTAGIAGGLTAAEAADVAALTGADLAGVGAGGGVRAVLGRGLGRAGVGVATAGGALSSLSAVDVAALAGAAFTLSKAFTYQTPAQQYASGLLDQVNQQGVIAGITGAPGQPGIISAMQALQGGSRYRRSDLADWGLAAGQVGAGIGHGRPGEAFGGFVRGIHDVIGGVGGLLGIGSDSVASTYDVNQKAIQSLSEAMVNALGTGRQVQQVWKGITGQALNMSQAADVATMSQLQLGTAFEKNGHLTQKAKQQIADLQAGYAPMTMNTGQFGAAVGAQTAMAGLQHTQVAAVNQAYDQLSQIVTGGAAGTANLFGMLGGTPSKGVTRGGLRFAQTPAIKQMAQALTSFTTAGGAAAWNTFTNQQSGMMTALGGNLDWLRTMQTMGALGPGQTTAMSAFQIAQMLPMARQSPAALAMLSQAAQEFGGPGFAPGTSASAMFKGLSRWAGKVGTGAGGFNQMMTTGIEKAANIPRDAQQFVQQAGSGIADALAQGIATHGSTLQDAFMGAVSSGKGIPQALSQYSQFLHQSGVPKDAASYMAQYAARISGGSPQVQAQVAQAVKQQYQATVKVHADTSQAAQSIRSLHGAPIPVKVLADASAAKAAVNSVRGKTIIVKAAASGVGAVQSAINSVRGKTVTVTVNYVVTGQPQLSRLISSAGTVAALGGHTGPGMQTGGVVPGSGSGDIIPAMLEPGEVVIPRSLVPLVAPFLAAHRVPGFGGMPQGASTHFAAGGIVEIPAAMRHPHHLAGGPLNWTVTNQGGQLPLPAAVNKVLDSLLKALSGSPVWHQFAMTFMGQFQSSIKGLPAETRKLAQGLVNQITQEIGFAKGVADAAKYGQGYDPTGKGPGIFGSMQVPAPGTPTGVGAAAPGTRGFSAAAWNAAVAAAAGPDQPQAKSVQQQMQDYLKTLQSFGKDIGTLGKGHLNKDIMRQLIAAGPVQGDALAQSILGGQGGIKAANQLWAQITKASTALGAKSATALYGGSLSPDMKSGTFVYNNVSISLSGKGGQTLDLSQTQIKQLVELIQAKLLQQARRNNKTGVKASGKGA